MTGELYEVQCVICETIEYFTDKVEPFVCDQCKNKQQEIDSESINIMEGQ